MTEQAAQYYVVISSPHALEAEWLARLITAAGCEVDCSPTIESLPDIVSARRPDLILLDGCFCGEKMCNLKDLAEQHTVAILTDRYRPGSFIHEAMRAGAHGCLWCDEDVERFTEAVRLLARGMVVITSEAARQMIDSTHTDSTSSESQPLSEQEMRIASMVALGATNREIGEELFISEHTVKVQLGRILSKLSLRNRQQLAGYVAQRRVFSGSQRQ